MCFFVSVVTYSLHVRRSPGQQVLRSSLNRNFLLLPRFIRPRSGKLSNLFSFNTGSCFFRLKPDRIKFQLVVNKARM